MKASIVDLRYKMNDIIKALDRNEEVTILYHGKEKGVIIPSRRIKTAKACEHAYFGMKAGENGVDEIMVNLRGSRFDAV